MFDPSTNFRRLIEKEPFQELRPDCAPWEGKGAWPCFWIGGPTQPPPVVAAYRRNFTLEKEVTVRVHVSGDERYELYLDGARIGRGSERGDQNHWFFETYDLPLSPGEHVIVARVWSLGGLAPVAQASVRHGFILAPDEDAFIPILGTGVAEWQWKPIDGFEFKVFPGTEGVGAKFTIEGKVFPWDFASGGGEGWMPATTLQAGASAARRNDYWSVHLMKPGTLPPMLEKVYRRGKVRLVAAKNIGGAIHSTDHLPAEAEDWTQLWEGNARVVIPSQTCRRVIIDLENYVCAYPSLTTTDGEGSTVCVNWTEALFSDQGKGNRDELEGKCFSGIGDIFKPDGGPRRNFEPLWWEAGRYLEIVIQTANTPLTIESFRLLETHYPLELESSFAASDPRLSGIIPILWRSLEMCSHETYMDCPFYEQLMYAGDTRTEILTTYAATRDDRLPRKALSLFAASRLPSGLTQSRYPSRGTQIIPPFSLWWVAMVYDYALWRGDKAFVDSLMPMVRTVMDVFINLINQDGLLQSPVGWNFVDWVNGWDFGVPPSGDGVSGVINLQFLLILRLSEKLETFCDRPELAAQSRRVATGLAQKIETFFWNEERGFYADDLAGQRYSEHAQCLAILAGHCNEARQSQIANQLVDRRDLAQTSVYFSHYLFETYGLVGKIDALLKRLDFWFALDERGLKTTPETADPCRSECHAWGAHPLYHYFATILGIRPAEMGFKSVRIAPQLGFLKSASGKFAHPLGDIEVSFQCDARTLTGTINLPPGLPGTFLCSGKEHRLSPGMQTVEASLP